MLTRCILLTENWLTLHIAFHNTHTHTKTANIDNYVNAHQSHTICIRRARNERCRTNFLQHTQTHIILRFACNSSQSLAIVDDADPFGVCDQLRREFPQKHIVFVAADLSMRSNVRRAFNNVRAQFGDDKIDVVIGCGASGATTNGEEATTDTWTEADDKRKAAIAACTLVGGHKNGLNI